MDGLGHDPATGSPPSAAGPSRRIILRAAGALGVAGAILRAAPASAATALKAASTPSLGPSFAGADKSAFATMIAEAAEPKLIPVLYPPPTAVRWYLDTETGSYPNENGYATTKWPDLVQTYNSPARALVSIRPACDLLVEGKFDAGLYAFMRSAPQTGPASLLTMWHECATFTLKSGSNYPQDPTTFRQGLSHLRALAAGQVPGYSQPTNVKVGVIDVNPSALKPFYPSYSNDIQAIYNMWMAPNLDWYGCDLYDNSSFNLSVYSELGQFRDYVNTLGSVPNANYPINLPECNSRMTSSGASTVATDGPTGYRRSDFFHYAWAWLQNEGTGGECSGLLGFWNGSGNEGSPWRPADNPPGSLSALFQELNSEFGQSSP